MIRALLTRWVFSIREFCELDMPIFMFDKDKNFVVMRLEQVCDLYFVTQIVY